MKTALITIQIDDIKLSDLEELEQNLQDAIQEFRRRRITLSVQDAFGPPIPVIGEED